MSEQSKPRKTLWKMLLFLAGLSPLIGIGALVIVALTGDLPNTETLANPRTFLATKIYTMDGKVLGSYYKENRSEARYEDLPSHLKEALISTEDVRYSHDGVDFYGLGRAIAFLGKRGGGSTITQQLAKLLFTEEYESTTFFERALLQKPKEWIIASRLEHHYTKGEIMTMYLNRYDFLNQAVGIRSAANIYFNKEVGDLKVEECAMLVGMLKNSALFNPLRRMELVTTRRNVVLNQMQKYGYLEESVSDSLKELTITLSYQKVSHNEGAAPYFRERLRSKLKSVFSEKNRDGSYVICQADGSPYNIYQDGLQVHTTIDSRLQKYAENAVSTYLGGELQAAFEKDLTNRNKSTYPFYDGIKPSAKKNILDIATRDSDRYKKANGELCPGCNRPDFYIKDHRFENGDKGFKCEPDKKGCGHIWMGLSTEAFNKSMHKPVKMKVFSHAGLIDTVLTPMDSIVHRKKTLHAGLLAIEPSSGQIKAWVGGIDYRFFQYDNVDLSKRQVGSTFKPFVYATALRMGMNSCDELPNHVTCIDLPEGYDPPRWCPENSSAKYGEIVTLEYALANSMNTITAKLIKDLGTDRVIKLAHALGIKSDIPNVPSIALGVAELNLKEMVAANSSLVNGGVYIEPTFLIRVEDRYGNTIYEPNQEMRQGLDEVTSYKVIRMMQGVVDGAWNEELQKRTGTGVRLRYDSDKRDYDGIKFPMAGKTGTTQNNTDGWFMGLTPDLVTGVWVGAQDPTIRFSSTRYGQGANTALPIYGFFMKDTYADEGVALSRREFTRPESLGADTLDCKEQASIKGHTFDSDGFDDSDLFN
ncbi:MAG: transglycosylase domain-containing protein [Bacteroidetes bacterium]|nr:transglycosylase domain-containing protein [Bacteroidota bacterium]